MSIISQALKKAQREQQSAPGGTAWVLPAAPQAGAPRRRGQALWIVTAALVALSLGVTLHAWLGSPTAGVETASEAARPGAAPLPQPQAMQPTKAAATDSEPARQRVTPAPRQAPAPANDRPRRPGSCRAGHCGPAPGPAGHRRRLHRPRQYALSSGCVPTRRRHVSGGPGARPARRQSPQQPRQRVLATHHGRAGQRRPSRKRCGWIVPTASPTTT